MAVSNITCLMHAGGSSGLDVLSKARDTQDDALSASAGRCLGFYPVVKTVLNRREIRTPECISAVECFLALCEVLDLLKLAAQPGKVTPGHFHRK